MDSTTAQSQVAALLKDVPGIAEVRTIEGGASVRYRATAISHEQICALSIAEAFERALFKIPKVEKPDSRRSEGGNTANEIINGRMRRCTVAPVFGQPRHLPFND